MQISVRKLKPELLEDFLHFFDKEAFSDFPDWSGCYCGFYETAGESWDAGPDAGPIHRKEKADRIKVGESTGLLAYVGGRVPRSLSGLSCVFSSPQAIEVREWVLLSSIPLVTFFARKG